MTDPLPRKERVEQLCAELRRLGIYRIDFSTEDPALWNIDGTPLGRA